jgi:hypothetical protein
VRRRGREEDGAPPAADRCGAITGQTIRIDGGITRSV